MGLFAAFALGLCFAAVVVVSSAEDQPRGGLVLATAGEEPVVLAWSARGDVAAVRSSDGKQLWGRRLDGHGGHGHGGTAPPLVRLGGGIMLARTASGKAETFDLVTGNNKAGFHCSKGELEDVVALDDGFLMVCEGTVSVVGFDGRRRWIISAGHGGGRFRGAALGASGEICLLADTAAGAMESRKVNPNNGRKESSQVLDSDLATAIRAGEAVLAVHSAAYILEGELKSRSLCGAAGDGSFDLKLVETRPPSPYHVMRNHNSAPGVLAISNGHFVISFYITPGTKSTALGLLRIENAQGHLGRAYTANGKVAEDALVLGLSRKDGWHVQEGSLARSDGKMKLALSDGFTGYSFKGAAEAVEALVSQRAAAPGEEPRVFAVGDAGSLMAMQGDAKLWELPGLVGEQRAEL